MVEIILAAMARAFFVSAWADQGEEVGVSFSGMEIMDLAPEAPEEAFHAARTLAADMRRANGRGLTELYESHPAGWTPQTWGHYAAMQAMGHGAGLSDDCPCDTKVPYVDFGQHSLHADYFEQE